MGRVDNRPVTQPSLPGPYRPATTPPQTFDFFKPFALPLTSQPSQTTPSIPTDQLQTSVPQGQALTQINLDPPENPQTHTVGRNESLSTIAKKYFGNPNLYMEIFNANRDVLSHPNQLRKGMVLKLPQHLFPQPEGTQPLKPSTALNDYRRQNPLSYVTLNNEEPKIDPRLMFDHAFSHFSNTQSSSTQSSTQPSLSVPLTNAEDHAALQGLTTREQTTGNTVIHDDAVKVNKRFDISPALSASNLATKFGPWAKEVAATLREHHASIRLPNAAGQSVTLTPEKLEELASKPVKELQDYFRKELGIALVNTLWAIDDVASDMQHDPYYADVKATPKTIDLAAVADDFNLKNDSLNYLAGTAAHRHKQVPIELHGLAAASKSTTPAKDAEQILADLSKHFNSKGVLTNPAKFEADVYKLLENQSARRQLIEKFDLNSAENLSYLAPAITSEGGMAESQRTYNSYFAVGSVMLNRALGRNLRKAAAYLAQNKPPDKFKPIDMKSIIFEQNQFEITWRAMPGAGGKTFFQYSQGLNQAFLKNKLGEGNAREAFATAYEVARDLSSGMNHLAAEVNGREQKNSGRSTADLFYFNQSRSQDFSQSNSAAVRLIDSNNTQVFFTRWGQSDSAPSYFMD